MRKTLFIILAICLSHAALFVTLSYSQVVLPEPYGQGFYAEQGDSTVHEMRINNFSDIDFSYTIQLTSPPEEEERQRGPRRDDLGDDVAQYQVEQGNWYSLAWDGERMWSVDYGDGSIIAFDPEEEEVEGIGERDDGGGTLGLTYDGENFWVADYNARTIDQMDREGGTIRSFGGMQGQPTGIAWDGEYIWFCERNGATTTIRQMDIEGDVVRTLEMPDEVNLNQSNYVAIVWVQDHSDGNLWIGDTGQNLYQVAVDPDIDVEETEFVQGTRLQRQIAYGIAHDGENIWHTFYQENGTWFVVDDGVEEPKWLRVYPTEGMLRSNDEAIILLTLQPADLEPGVYERRMLVHLLDVDNELNPIPESPLELSYVLSFEVEPATIIGQVTDYATDEPIRDAQVSLDTYFISRYTRRNGDFEFEYIPLGLYEMTYRAEDYLPVTWDLFIDEAGVFDSDAALRHSTCDADADSIVAYMPVEAEQVIDITIVNNGNGPLTYTAATVLPEEVHADAWDLREFIGTNEPSDHSQPGGVIYIDDYFYVTGSHANDTNYVYVLDRDGELENVFLQYGDARRGYKDLTWDGELIWGCSGDRIYGFERDGELVHDLEGPHARGNRVITWDKDREVFWIADIVREIISMDIDGNHGDQLNRLGLYIYGLSYWPEDPDGYNLYLMTRPIGDANRSIVYKMNPDSGDTMYVTELFPEGAARSSGIHITKRYDGYSWVMMSIADVTIQNNIEHEGIRIQHLATNYGLMNVEPELGVLQPEESEVLTITLNSEGMFETMVGGDLFIDHDGVGDETVLPIMMNIFEGPQPPRVFNLLEPDSGALITNSEVTFRWDSSFDLEDELRYNFSLISLGETSSFDLTETSFIGLLDTLGVEIHNDTWIEWRVAAIGGEDTTWCSVPFSFFVTGLDASDNNVVPSVFALEGVYPNPFNSVANIVFNLDREGSAKLQIYDLSGRLVESLHSGWLQAGSHTANWDGRDIASGIYFVRLESAGRVLTQRIALVR